MPHPDYELGRQRFLTGQLLPRWVDIRRRPWLHRGWMDAFEEAVAEAEKNRDPNAEPYLFRKQPPEREEGTF